MRELGLFFGFIVSLLSVNLFGSYLTLLECGSEN